MIVFSSVATGEWVSMCPQVPTPVRPGHGNCRNPRRKKWRVWGYRIILAKELTLKYLVTKDISKLNQIQIMCQILIFNYLTTLQTNTQNNLGAHALLLNTQSCAWFGSCSQGSFRAGTHRTPFLFFFLMTGTPFRSFSAYSCKI